jgi:hypothetical protein
MASIMPRRFLFVFLKQILLPWRIYVSSIFYVIGVKMSNAYTQSLSTTLKLDNFVSVAICIVAAAILSVMGNKIHNMFEVQKLDTELY